MTRHGAWRPLLERAAKRFGNLPRLSVPAAVGAAACLVGLGFWVDRLLSRPVTLDTAQSVYYRDQMVTIRLRTRDRALRRRLREKPGPRVAVRRGSEILTTIAGIRWQGFRWDDEEGAFVARWPVPWNAPAGRYELSLENADEFADRLEIRAFELARRQPKRLPPGFAALSLETSKPLSTLRVTGPDGVETDWRGLLDWAQYLEADAFWMLVGETPGREPGRVWLEENLALVPRIAEEARKRGLVLGLYAMCYLTMSKERLERYEYAWDVEDSRPKLTRAISLRDPRRPGDVAELLKRFKDIPGVEHVGLDYIRNALGGYELIEEFFREMPGVRPPPEWERLTHDERMVWFHHKKVMRRDLAFVDAWQWWRAHRVGRIVREIKHALGPEETLWAFTLTWDKGWHHGQAPAMMNDAGVDADALMLYEADSAQFNVILKEFRRYLDSGDVQLVVGDVVDWPLHQRAPDGPKEMRRRLVRAVDGVYRDGAPAPGLFVHDVGRALWGRLGPFTTKQWMEEARRAVLHLRSRHAQSRLAEGS